MHSGQVAQPRPEPVPRTSPPTANSTMVVTAVARASFWKRVMERADARLMICRRGTAPSLAILMAMAADPIRAGAARRSARSALASIGRSTRSSIGVRAGDGGARPDALLPSTR